MIDTNSYTKAEDIRFMEALSYSSDQESWWREITTIKPSVSLTDNYRWLGDMPGVKEWLDERVIEALKDHEYAITNKDWENTIGISVNELKDNPGFVEPRIPMIADKMARHPNKLLAEAMVDGTTNLCYDGKAFYATDHPVDGDAGNTFSNLLTGTGITVATVKTDFQSLITAMLELTDRAGDTKFESIGKLRLVYPAELHTVFVEAFEAEKASGGATNIYAGIVELQALGRLTDAKDWYVIKMDSPLKPFVYQDRQKIKTEWELGDEFHRKFIYFGADARYNVGYTLPELSFKINNT